ncbi:MAG: hypothetical protein LBF58_06800 [Deltaproteobacteria bacterium]|jgi:hypothetical protein|nr:hypothetical protein [Deltaproteobacteria bacterium]
MAKSRARGGDGLILPFTLFILVLISLMGVILLAASQGEVVQEGHERLAKGTFQAAESSAMVAMFLARVLVRPELGDPSEALRAGKGAFPLGVEINVKRFSLSQVLRDSGTVSYGDRYAGTGWAAPGQPEPHLRFRLGGRPAASAVVHIDKSEPFPAGASIGVGDGYDASAGGGKRVTIIVSVRGLGDDPGSGRGPTVFITSMFREII